MKTVLNLVLAACVICLVYICYGSIMGPINFDNAKKTREKAIIARLIDIRKAQQEYRTVHNGAYTANFDSLITFVKTAKLPFIMKVGSLTDDQLNNGMTEKKAMDLLFSWMHAANTVSNVIIRYLLMKFTEIFH